MKLRITGRHMAVTPALRDYVEARFNRLDRYGLKVGSLQVVLGVEKLQHKAEVVGSANGRRVQAKTSTREMYATIDALVDRIDAQFRRWKERLVDHKSGKTRRPRALNRGPVKWGQGERCVVEQRAVPVLSVDQAEKQFGVLPPSALFMLFINSESGRVQVVQRGTGGKIVVIEPYPEGERMNALP